MKTKEQWLDSEQWHEIGDNDVLELIDRVQQDALSDRTPSPELVELRKDKERLDWLSSKPVDGFIMALTPTATLFDWSSEDSQSLRTAIDTAMKEK